MIRAVVTALLLAPVAAGAATLDRDAVARPLLLDAGQREAALEVRDYMPWPSDDTGRPASGDAVLLAPRIRAGLGKGLEAELSAQNGVCVGRSCTSSLQDAAAVLHVRLLEGGVELAGVAGVAGWRSAAVATGAEPLLRTGVSLRAGLEGRVRPAPSIAIRARAVFDGAVTGRAVSLSAARPGYVEYNRDTLEAALELRWGPAEWFSLAVEGAYLAVIDPPLRFAANQQLPASVQALFTLPHGIDLGLRLGYLTLGPHRVGNREEALLLGASTAVSF